MSARFSYKSCRHCLGSGCLHCNHRGSFLKRLSPRLSEREAAVLRFLRSGSSEGNVARGAGILERRHCQ